MRLIGLVLALGLTLAPLAAEAQQTSKTWRVGYLGYRSAMPPTFGQGLRDLGYEEGKNIVIDRREATSYDQLPALAAELVRSNVDLIVTHGNQGVRAAKQATTTIPIVMAISGDAVRAQLVASLARPGGNVTGSTFFNPELHVKRLELFKERLSRARRGWRFSSIQATLEGSRDKAWSRRRGY